MGEKKARTRRTVNIDVTLHRRLGHLAVDLDTPLSTLVNRAIEELLAREASKKGAKS